MRGRLLAAAVALAVAGGAVLVFRPGNRPPELVLPPQLRVTIGSSVEVQLEADDPDGDELAWSAPGLPPGARLAPDGRLAWSPGDDQAGRYRVWVEARDADGASGVAPVELLARHRANPGVYLAMGDSVASGHGLDPGDWLGGDSCWRDGDDSYPARFLRLRAGGGVGAAPLRQLALVACSGHTSADLMAEPVDGGPDLARPPGPLSQLEWALVTNPGLVTVTVGANDLGFGDPERVVGRGGSVDHAYVDARLARLEANLTQVLRRLVDATDARVIVSTYHDPTADDPQGVPGCRGRCFRRVTGEVVAALNRSLRAAAATVAPGRVAVAEVAGAFEAHGAPNGRGPDFLRDGTGIFSLPAPLDWTADIHPYCAKGHRASTPAWVSAADCVHPNRAGAIAYAEALDAAWRTARWGPA